MQAKFESFMKQMQENNKKTIQLDSDEKFSYSILNDKEIVMNNQKYIQKVKGSDFSINDEFSYGILNNQEGVREVKGSDTFSIIKYDANQSF
jgi:hypothetical protein